MTKTPKENKTGEPRAAALELLTEILEKDGMSHLVLRRGLQAHPEYDKQQRAFLTRLVEGTVERCLELDYIIGQYSSVPVKKMKPVIRTILRMSVYQLLYMDSVPDSAVCNEAVKLASRRGFAGLKGFVNGLLRRIAAEKDQIAYPPADTPEGLSVRYSMPVWILDKWLAAYGRDRTEVMLQAMLQDRPLIVHMNLSRQSRDRILESLHSQNVKTAFHSYSDEALILTGADRPDQLEAFARGWIQPQDISSQLASSLSVQAMKRLWQERGDVTAAGADKEQPVPLRILDVCAAPGGKSLYAADAACRLSIPVTVTARDLTADKTAMIEENRCRVGLMNLYPETHDALIFLPQEEESADIVIADLPCSGLGIMARKNDIKYRMTEEAQRDLADLQRRILSVIWRYVKPGGYLLYSTCTINPEENEQNFRWLQENYPFGPVDLTSWLPAVLQTAGASHTAGEGFLQLLPGLHDSDGFFLSALQRPLY